MEIVAPIPVASAAPPAPTQLARPGQDLLLLAALVQEGIDAAALAADLLCRDATVQVAVAAHQLKTKLVEAELWLGRIVELGALTQAP